MRKATASAATATHSQARRPVLAPGGLVHPEGGRAADMLVDLLHRRGECTRPAARSILQTVPVETPVPVNSASRARISRLLRR
jgi:hypothetical protein